MQDTLVRSAPGGARWQASRIEILRIVPSSVSAGIALLSSELAPCFLCNASRMMSARAANVIDNIYFFVYGNVKFSVVLTRRGDLKMANPQAQFPRVVRAAPEPLG